MCQSVSFKTYKNPVIPGDHPDCTVSKIGNDYYTTGSSFNLEPQIYHSTNLVNWRVIAKPVSAAWEGFGDTPGGGCWGGQMVYYNNKYWHYFSRANVMYFTTADKPEGPWNSPTRVKDPHQLPYTLGYDNSLFIDDDGKWYLIVKNGQPNNGIVELGNDGQPTGVVYNLAWLNPAPSLPYSWAEGPVMWKYKGYYYYSFARDLSGGQKVMRSKILTDKQSEWEMLGDLFNENDPLKPGSLFTGPNHSSAVIMAPDSTFWLVHPLYAKGEWRGQGRQGLLNQVFYDANGKPTAVYPINSYFTAPQLPSSGIPWMVPKSDFFESDKLNPEWQFYGYNPLDRFSLTERKGWLRLSPKNNKFNPLTKKDAEHNYSLITVVDFNPQSPKDEAGLIIMRGDEKMFVKLASSFNELRRKTVRFSFKDKTYQSSYGFDGPIWLKLVRINHEITGYFSENGISWEQIGQSFNISEIDSYSDFSTFTGTRQGLFVQNRIAYFDLYIYRDAYTPILAECPANEFGTQRTTLSKGIYLLDSIHHNDWALYAGVEFGTENYPLASDSVEFIASSATEGGIIEIWLDSIDTGTKIANCKIESTGTWNNFKSFKAKTKKITGRHDVYLRFIGPENKRLFQLKWIKFIPIQAPRLSKTLTSDDGKILQVYFTQPLLLENSVYGFSVFSNNKNKVIDSMIIDSKNNSKINIYLNEPITFIDTITLTYKNGNVYSKDSLALAEFENYTVPNQVAGSKPYIKKIITNNDGNKITIYFTKKMFISPSQCKQFILKINSTNLQIPSNCDCTAEDSTQYTLSFNNTFFYEDTLSLNYYQNDLIAINGGLLGAFQNFPITNIAKGYPLKLKTVTLRKTASNYSRIVLKFDKPLYPIDNPKDFFELSINNKVASIKSALVNGDSIEIFISPYPKLGDTILFSYKTGDIKSIYLGKLDYFYDYPVLVGTKLKCTYSEKFFVISPNPASNYFNIYSTEKFDNISIYNNEGKILMNKKIPLSYSYKINMQLSKGIYYIRISTEKNYKQQKLLIK